MNQEQLIWQKALDYLGIRFHSKYELRQKLTRHFPDEEEKILKAIAEMERVELLNDRRFTEQLVNSLIQKPIGRFKLMMEIKKRGLEPELAENMLLNFGWSEEESAKKAIAEKERSLREPDERKRKRKLMNFLQSRGFESAMIYKVLNF
ncbi:hypothetical protein COY07_01730 [Candidatus Peregrinibacteria bacterium CG_4_10_14_0_2_um_filter_43_11]|nr:MAG: hypothetical protein COY07_01730 [Candidatus Peregrinibacteria bacterium CG_4_10_14_0_2_um_filter_43_11]